MTQPGCNWGAGTLIVIFLFAFVGLAVGLRAYRPWGNGKDKIEKPIVGLFGLFVGASCGFFLAASLRMIFLGQDVGTGVVIMGGVIAFAFLMRGRLKKDVHMGP